MSVKKLLIIISAIAVAAFPVAVCFADGGVELSQAYAWEQNVDVFIAGSMDSDTLSCKVSNQAAEVVGSGGLADWGTTVRTTLLIDVSASIPSKTRGNVKSYIDTLIQSIGKNEQYKIVTFGEQLNVLQDFSADRYDLSGAADKIEFTARQSRIYDAVYNTIPKTQPIEGEPCYYRTIVITDGVDDTASGVTKEELYLKLQNDTYPIDVVAVSAAKQTEQDKELSALTRISGGRYVGLDPSTDITALSSALSVNNVFWLRVTVPGTLLDGSMRQIDITDGVNSIEFDIKMPAFDVPQTPTPEQPETAAPESEQPATPPEITPSEPEQPEPATTESAEPEISLPFASLLGEYALVAYIGAGAVIVIAGAVIAAVVVIRRKKKSSSGGAPVNGGGSIALGAETELLSAAPGSIDGNPCIRLRNMNADNQAWDVSIAKGVLVGRDTGCQVCLADPSVSRRQCRIYMGSAVTAENLSKSNVTRLNGKPLNVPTAIMEGDKLKCGRITLIVESLYASGSGFVGDMNKGTAFINV
jgi:hypothetical protein